MKKRQVAILCFLFALVMILGGILLYTVRMYTGTGLSVVKEFDLAYDYNGKFLLPPDQTEALFYNPVGRADFKSLKKKSIDLSPYGYEGKTFDFFEYSTENQYGVVYTNYYPLAEGYEGFWPVCTGGNFIYIAENGEKIRILPESGLSFPMFADSIEGVDPYGKEILGFSANASWALSLSGTEVTLYHTDPMDDSLRIVETKKISLAEYGTSLRFGAFVGNSQAYFIAEKDGKESFVALDCTTGETAPSKLDPKGAYGEVIDRLYAQRLDAEGEEGGFVLSWSHLLLAQEHTSPVIEEFKSGEIFAVSPAGGYALARVDGEKDILAVSEKRAFSLTSVLEEGEKALDADFIYENVILVTLEKEGEKFSRCYKICF